MARVVPASRLTATLGIMVVVVLTTTVGSALAAVAMLGVLILASAAAARTASVVGGMVIPGRFTASTSTAASRRPVFSATATSSLVLAPVLSLFGSVLFGSTWFATICGLVAWALVKVRQCGLVGLDCGWCGDSTLHGR